MRGRRSGAGALGAGVAMVVLLLAGCASLPTDDDGARAGGSDGDAPDTSGGPSDGNGPVGDGGSDEMLVQVATSGGYVPAGWDFQTVPSLTLYADGLAITHGPTTLEYPGRLLPNLLTHRLTADQLGTVRQAADEAGLLAPAPDYGTPGVTDVGTTTVTITVDGETWRHDAYGLGIADDDDLGGLDGLDGLDEDARAARRALTDFRTVVETEIGAAGESGTYTPERFAVMAREADPGTADEVTDLPAGEHPWPLEELTATDCRVVEGDDAAALGGVLQGARQGDRFTHDGVTYDVWVRVLLPGEAGCTDGERAPRG